MAGWDVRVALDELETEILRACSREEEWPARVAAGVYAGVDFAIARPAIASDLVVGVAQSPLYEGMVIRLAGIIKADAPIDSRLPSATDEALVAGIIGLVGDHVRVGRLDRLAELRPELVLLTLLPYLGFEEAQAWANRAAGQEL